MKRIFYVLAFVLLCSPLVSCSLDDNGSNFEYVALKVVSAEVPDSFELGQTYEIMVKYLKPNSCTFFEGFDIHKHELTTREVYPIGTEITDLDDCQELVEEVEESFDFIVLYEDDYTFQFWTGKDADGVDQYIEIDVPVN